MDIQKMETVVYDNTFNKTSLNLLTQVQSDVLMAVLSQMSKLNERDEEGRLITKFYFEEIRNLTNMRELYYSRLKNTLDDLINTKVEFFNEDEYYKGSLFSNYYLTSKNEVKITLSTDMTKKLIVNKNQYTVLNLSEYVELKNRYSKELYRILRQFRRTGMLVMKKEDLLNSMNPPKSYNEYDFIRKGLKRAIEDNKKYFKELRLVNIGKGHKLPDICHFSFKKHQRSKSADEIIADAKDNKEADLLLYILQNGGGKK